MRFAVVGDLAEAAVLVEQIHRSTEHELSACCVDGPLLQQMQHAAIPFSSLPSTDDVVLAERDQIVIVAESNSEASIQSIRRASQEECPVLAFAPSDVSTAWSYEAHLLLDEASTGILPVTGRWFADPKLRLADQSTLQQLTLSLPLQADEPQQRRQQFHAIDLMIGTGIRFSQVTGLDLNGPDGRPLTRTVTLGAAALDAKAVPPALIRFESKPPAETEIVVEQNDGHQQNFEVFQPLGNSAAADGSGRLIEPLLQALKDPTSCQSEMELLSNSLELLEGLDKSFRRRRTVDVYLDSVSERAVFKTQMTAIGCGVLGYLMFGMVAYLMIAQLLKPSPAILNVARILWIAPLVLFLIAQLLLPLARDRTPAPNTTEKPTDEAS